MPNIMQMGDEARFLGSWDVMDGEITLTISDFKEEIVEGDKGRKEKKCILYFAEKDRKPMVLNLTNRKMLAKLYHTVNSEKLKGKRITIGTDKVKAFGGIHDALRIRPVVPAQTAPKQSDAIKCEQCGKAITAAHGMDADKLAQYTAAKYGKKLCANCAAEQAKAGAE